MLRIEIRDGVEVRQLRCPDCGEYADIDDDQFHGRVSVWHDIEDGGCGYHETKDWSALVGEVEKP